MKNKTKQLEAVASSFNRTKENDWEVIATEQHEENVKLTSDLEKLKSKLEKTSSSDLRIDPKRVRNWKYSDRNSFEMGDLENLAEDIRENGQLQPAIVRKVIDDDYDYEIIAGERRWRACKIAGVDLWANLTNKDDADCIVIQTSENKKKSLSPYSLARTYQELMADLDISQNELAKRLGIPKSSFGDLLSFNKVPDIVWSSVKDMSLVKPTTATYLNSLCKKSSEHIHSVIKVADKIREGMGVDSLKKQIEKHLSNAKTKRNSALVYTNDKGLSLFRITSEGRVSISKPLLAKVDLKELGEHLKKYLDEIE